MSVETRAPGARGRCSVAAAGARTALALVASHSLIGVYSQSSAVAARRRRAPRPPLSAAASPPRGGCGGRLAAAVAPAARAPPAVAALRLRRRRALGSAGSRASGSSPFRPSRGSGRWMTGAAELALRPARRLVGLGLRLGRPHPARRGSVGGGRLGRASCACGCGRRGCRGACASSAPRAVVAVTLLGRRPRPPRRRSARPRRLPRRRAGVAFARLVRGVLGATAGGASAASPAGVRSRAALAAWPLRVRASRRCRLLGDGLLGGSSASSSSGSSSSAPSSSSSSSASLAAASLASAANARRARVGLSASASAVIGVGLPRRCRRATA